MWVAGLLLAVLMTFSVFVYTNLGQGLSASMDDSLQLSASQATTAANIENGQITLSDSIAESGNTTNTLSERGLTIRVLDPTGQVVQAIGPYRTLSITTESLAAALQQQSTFATVTDPIEHVSVRFYTAPIVENNHLVGVIQVAQSLDSITKTLNRLLTALLIGVPVLVIITAFGGYFLAAHALAPIDNITRTARRISAEDLSARLNLPATDDEVGRLAATFDTMLSRLDTSFKRERQFTADASHELRTPLAAMQAILSVVRGPRLTPEDYEHALDDLSEEANRLRSLVENLLRLARGDSRPPAARQTVDLSVLLCDVTDSLLPLAEAKGLTLTYAAPDGLTLSGDRDDLIRLFVNLLENAVKYTEHGTIAVTAHANTDTLKVTVSDTGIGIPSHHLPYIFDRFYRVDASRASQGSGLGLAIALDIARAHGGTLEVTSVVGAGTTFTVRLPTR
jgi:heavy metal sensor kinase